ncbi:hypothetical protein HORIV_38530 [Vreelandella olivaria]|uniref:Uncharacterized protein n=1 Tax=Vreelandella olivaria TaxID=390919 RepID=A0ABM7GL23_9GAMM|nr:hypothetical protein HORIV_38530 [Halomonas olivaria]
MPLLPNEPGFVDAATRHAITEQRFIPARNEFGTLFFSLRKGLDPKLLQYRVGDLRRSPTRLLRPDSGFIQIIHH